MHFKKFFLLYTLIPLLVLSTAASYYRFMVIHDYIVEYEGECDPVTDSCFIGCEDDECTTQYPYRIITKNASQLLEQCGADITDCESAQICLPQGDIGCNISLCKPDLGDDCYTTEESEQDILNQTSL